MATANLRKLGSHAPLSVVILLAISAMFLLLTACGESEDFPPSPDAGTGHDATGGDATSTQDTNPQDTPSYEEVCAECEDRGEDCSAYTPEDYRILRQELRDGITLEEVADAVCPPSCEEFQDVEDYVWTCTGTMGDPMFEDWYVDENCTFRKRGGGGNPMTHGPDSGPRPWEYHAPGSISITMCSPSEEGDVCWRDCTGTPKEE